MSAGFVPLPHLLSDGRPPTWAVAVGRAGARDWTQFTAHVAALSAAVTRVGGGRWLLCSEDSYAVAVGLFALAHAGACAVLAPNERPGTLRCLGRDAVGAVLDPGMTVGGAPHPVVLHPLDQPPETVAVWPALDPDAPFVEFFTSGTTRARTCVPKALRHLAAEVETLEECFGALLGGDTMVVATVSHQHIYGLLFRVLWPLAAGRRFRVETSLLPDELLARLGESGDGALVTTPVHLKRLWGLDGFGELRSSCRAVFSSGAPLDFDTADGVRRVLGSVPYEVFGSTETGGVAWRLQSSRDAGWIPFPRVWVGRADADGRLLVRSPLVSVGSDGGGGERSLVMGDRIEPDASGRFRLLGRADRVTKIGAKRLSLPEMESNLRAHPWIAEAALLVLERASEPRVHAVAVLTDEGRRSLRSAGRRLVNRQLTEHLASHWDRVLLPRIWRYVEELPCDAQGKTSLPALRALFADDTRAAAGTTRPQLLAETRARGTLERHLVVPADLVFLRGHYGGFPVVAGVVQLSWVVDAAAEWLGHAPRIRAIRALKFKDVLLPEQRFRMRLETSPEGDCLRFRLWDGKREFSQGRCLLGAAAGESR